MAIIPSVKKRFQDSGSPVKWLSRAAYEYLPLHHRALAWADALVGIREHGANKGADVEEITKFAGLGSKGGFAWCAMFVYYCLRHAGVRAGSLPAKGKCAAVLNWVAWAENKGRLVDSPARGRLFCWLDARGRGHIGFCLGGSALGVFRTIEGNTDGEDGSREGDGAYKRTRTMWGMRKHHRHYFIDLGGLG